MEEWTKEKDWPYYPSGDGKTIKETYPTHIIVENALYKTPFYSEGYVYWYALEKGGKMVRKPVPSFEILVKMIEICDALYKPSLSLSNSKSGKILQKFVFDLQNILKRFPIKQLMDPILGEESMKEVVKASRLLRSFSEENKKRIVELGELYKEVIFQ